MSNHCRLFIYTKPFAFTVKPSALYECLICKFNQWIVLDWRKLWLKVKELLSESESPSEIDAHPYLTCRYCVSVYRLFYILQLNSYNVWVFLIKRPLSVIKRTKMQGCQNSCLCILYHGNLFSKPWYALFAGLTLPHGERGAFRRNVCMNRAA